MNLNNTTIALIGLGYVGLPLAVEFGKHRPVIGFDINQTRVAELQGGQDHTLECSPEQLKAAQHLRFSSQLDDLRDCGIFIVIGAGLGSGERVLGIHYEMDSNSVVDGF